MDCKNKENRKKVKKITPEGYWNCLSPLSPRKEMLKYLSEKCGVTEQAVYYWFHGTIPQKYEHIVHICEYTGLTPDSFICAK